MEEHTHLGDPTYFAYVHCGCRHPDCKAAATEYRQRLQARRRRGDWRDLRYKADAQTADRSPEPVAGEQLALVEAPANPPDVPAVRVAYGAMDDRPRGVRVVMIDGQYRGVRG